MEDDPALLSFKTRIGLSLLGIVVFPLLHRLLTLALRWKFHWLHDGQAFRISTRTVSGVQAVAVVIISARAVITCNDVMKDEDPYLHSYIWFGVSYFPYDIIVMYIGNTYSNIHKEHHTSHSRSFLSYFKRDCVMVLHHIIFLLVGFPIAEILKKRIGDFFLACFFLAEISTPFYSIRGIMREVGIKSGRLYEINGIAFMVMFLFGRVLSIPFMFLRYSYFANMPLLKVPLKIPAKCTITCFFFFMLQFYWFRQICSTVMRHLSKKKGSKSVTEFGSPTRHCHMNGGHYSNNHVKKD